MEIINENKMPENPKKDRYSDETAKVGRLYWGVILIAAGLAWLFYNQGWISYRIWDFLFSWEILLVLIGGYLLSIRKWIAGGIVGGLGVLFLFMDYFSIRIFFGPLVIIVIGVSLLLTQLNRKEK